MSKLTKKPNRGAVATKVMQEGMITLPADHLPAQSVATVDLPTCSIDVRCGNRRIIYAAPTVEQCIALWQAGRKDSGG